MPFCNALDLIYLKLKLENIRNRAEARCRCLTSRVEMLGAGRAPPRRAASYVNAVLDDGGCQDRGVFRAGGGATAAISTRQPSI